MSGKRERELCADRGREFISEDTVDQMVRAVAKAEGRNGK